MAAFAVVAAASFTTPTRSVVTSTRAAGAVAARRAGAASLRMADAKDVKEGAKAAAKDVQAAAKSAADTATEKVKQAPSAAKAAAPKLDANQNAGAGKFGAGADTTREAKMDAPDIFGAVKNVARGKSQDEMWEENSKDKGPTGKVQEAAGNVEKAKKNAGQ
ncbi:hypothetical protein BU14_0518s0006 [Porphyra umbilicalis]|uniref:Uncharacterized protein n=1 Tax=Porphyra umbilicalis TaxID=2786 RepID=A0A1X6NSN0_PORUM|nr:hypothetical protein BU14_0518s0006 [Porphyra umbilicalis]|eukprot:OSX71614.1 hypothetical protein BU14_0518s0006 [Porphyra umbilicalis]